MRKISIWGILALGLLLGACEKEQDQGMSDLDSDAFPSEEEGAVFDEEDLADLFEEEDSLAAARPSDEDEREAASKQEDYDIIGEEVPEEPAEKQAPTAPSYPATDEGEFLVVTGSFSIKENAESMAQKLRGKGFGAAKVVYFNAREFHSVVAGEYANLPAAREVADALKREGIEAYVHKKRYGSGKR